MGKLSPEERASVGKALNAAKQALESGIRSEEGAIRKRSAARSSMPNGSI